MTCKLDSPSHSLGAHTLVDVVDSHILDALLDVRNSSSTVRVMQHQIHFAWHWILKPNNIIQENETLVTQNHNP